MKTFLIVVLMVVSFALLIAPLLFGADMEGRGAWKVVVWMWPVSAACALAAVAIHLLK